MMGGMMGGGMMGMAGPATVTVAGDGTVYVVRGGMLYKYDTDLKLLAQTMLPGGMAGGATGGAGSEHKNHH